MPVSTQFCKLITAGVVNQTNVHRSFTFLHVKLSGNAVFSLPNKKLLSLTIHTKSLVKRYRNRTVANQVSIDVKQGEIVGLLGPNGAGKTTTFYMVVGFIKPDEGEVFLNDENITKMAMYKRAQMGIGYLPQEASVFRKLTVEENIAAVLEMTNLSKEEQAAKLEDLLTEFRLHHVRKNMGDSLSGGERRRTEIARALAVDPKFILLDEPFAGVDPIAVEDIQSVVAKLKYKNIGILITDHNVTETLSICDRAYLLIEGKIFKHGTAEELADDEHVRRLYLGRNFELKRKDYLHTEAIESAKQDAAAFQEAAANREAIAEALDTTSNKTETISESVEAKEQPALQSTPELVQEAKQLAQLSSHALQQTEAMLKALDNAGVFKMSYKTNIESAAQEFFQSVKETKNSLIKFATSASHFELLVAAKNIPDMEYNTYARMISLADTAGGMMFLGIGIKIFMGLVYNKNIRTLESNAHQTKESLGKAMNYLKAYSNS
jgi:lipopolysaccharide export system ATP-binding protein